MVRTVPRAEAGEVEFVAYRFDRAVRLAAVHGVPVAEEHGEVRREVHPAVLEELGRRVAVRRAEVLADMLDHYGDWQ